MKKKQRKNKISDLFLLVLLLFFFVVGVHLVVFVVFAHFFIYEKCFYRSMKVTTRNQKKTKVMLKCLSVI